MRKIAPAYIMFKRVYQFLFYDELPGSAAVESSAPAVPLGRMLKADVARLVLFAYLLLVLNPVMPCIADKMAHTFWLEYHLISVHYVYGKTHLYKELAADAKQADKDKSAVNIKTPTDIYCNIIYNIKYICCAAVFSNVTYPAYRTKAPIGYHALFYQPPQSPIA